MNLKSVKVIYIAGYGRSGSTLLSMLLNVTPDVYNLGELANLYSLNESSLPKYWVDLRNDVLSTSSTPNRATKKYTSLLGLLFTKRGAKYFNMFWNPVLLRFKNDKNARAIIDASKTTNSTLLRPYYYKKQKTPIKSIHLVRDLNGVVSSFIKGRNTSNSKKLEKPKIGGAYRAIFNWLLTNVLTSIQHKLYFDKDEYYVLSYDVFINNFDYEMHKLLDFLNLPKEQKLFNENIVLEKDHSFSGNRVRLNDTLQIKPAESKKISGFIGCLIRFSTFLFKLFESDYDKK